MKILIPLTIAIIVVHIAPPAFAGQAESAHIASPADSHPGKARGHKAARMGKAGSALASAVAEFRAHAKQHKKAEFRPTNRFLLFDRGYVLVDVRAARDAEVLLNELNQLGLENGKRYGDVISGMLPIAAVEEAVALERLRAISATRRPIRRAGSITSQGDIALRADVARSVFAVDGTGVTVGVISDSYDVDVFAATDAATDIMTGDLPLSGVTVIGVEDPFCGIFYFCVDEGRALAQIIHDIAPGAAILFHTGDSVAGMAGAILALAAAGADIIIDDLLFLNEPMFQDGLIAEQVDIVTASGVVYFAAAGNESRQSYEAPFSDSGVIFCRDVLFPSPGACDMSIELVGTMHDFDPGPGEDFFQSVTIPVDTALIIAMAWDAWDPLDPLIVPGVVNDHDIVLVNSTGAIVDIGATDNIMTGEGMEFVQFYNDSALGFGTAFHIVITFDSDNSPGASTNLIKMVFFGEDGFFINEYQTDSSTLYGHANAAGAVSVGAASFLDTPEWGSPPILEPFSSAGGTPILIDTLGARLVVPEVRLKPEIIAVDGVNTTFFFEDLIGDIKFDFFGTSAAAAHAAGVAALMLEADPAATPAQIKTDLESTTLDMGVPGFDHDSGYGLIQAELAVAAGAAGGPDTDADGVPDSVDNCIDVPNGPFIPDSGGHGLPQWDTDGDGFGNMCDADLDNSGFVNFGDLAAFKAVFGTPDPHADFNGSGFVNFGDLARFKALFGQPPGPSGVSP